MQAISKINLCEKDFLKNLNSKSLVLNKSSVKSKEVNEIIEEQKEALKDLKVETNKDELIIMMDCLSPIAKQALKEDYIGNSPRKLNQSF